MPIGEKVRVANEQKESRDAEIGFDNFLFWVGKGLTFFFHKSSFQNAVRKKTRARAFFCRATPHMEGGRRRLDGDDDDDDEMCDQKRSRVARWALEEVRRRFRFALGAFSLRQKHFKKQLTPKTHLSLSLSLRPLSLFFSFRARSYQFFYPLFENEEEEVPAKCPLRRSRDRYLNLERMKRKGYNKRKKEEEWKEVGTGKVNTRRCKRAHDFSNEAFVGVQIRSGHRRVPDCALFER